MLIQLKYVISLILVTMYGLFYQATSAMFVLLALVLIAIKHKGNIKAIIKDTIFIAVIYGIAMIVNFFKKGISSHLKINKNNALNILLDNKKCLT